ncbi:MAG: flavin reductase family protein [Rhodospirillales bacterium]|nr:flavin reductase family protein [Rhodospirillales bacterium]
MTGPDFDTRAFRNALGLFPTGITVITTLGPDEKPEGLTANSFGAVSLEPALVHWCLGKKAPSMPVFQACTHFAINVLKEDQRDISNKFATPAVDKFEGVDWRRGLGGSPIIASSLAVFECRHTMSYEGGDHLIFIGGVEEFTHVQGAPLLFSAGAYGVARPHPDDYHPDPDAIGFHDLML